MQSTPTSETFHSDGTLRGAGRPLGRIAVHTTGKRYVRFDPRSFEHIKKQAREIMQKLTAVELWRPRPDWSGLVEQQALLHSRLGS